LSRSLDAQDAPLRENDPQPTPTADGAARPRRASTSSGSAGRARSDRFDRLWNASPEIRTILVSSADLEAARTALLDYLDRRHRELGDTHIHLHPLEQDLALNAIDVLRSIVSRRSEYLSAFSALRRLREIALGAAPQVLAETADAWVEEMRHIFLAIEGRTGVYQEEESEARPTFGREAALRRSDELDALYAAAAERMDSYPSGLAPRTRQRRAENRARILRVLGGSEQDWHSWRWQIRNVVRDETSLAALVHLSDAERRGIAAARRDHIPFGATPFYVSLMDHGSDRSRDHAIRMQVVPPLGYVHGMRVHKERGEHSADFMLERDTSPIDLVTRRYPSVVILKPYNTCAQICVYCQRNWEVTDVLCPTARASKESMLDAIQWIADHPAIYEVLVTGGDPMILNDGEIEDVLSRLAAIGHIERIRIGTRTPVVLPQRITPRIANIIARFHEPGVREMCIVTHFEHPYEVSEEAMQAVQQFRTRGMAVYNQLVFTSANSRRFEVAALRRVLRLIGVDPYYTFATKGKEETRAYRAPIARLLQEAKEEARILPGLARTDEAVYNVPGLGKNYLRAWQHRALIMILPDGRRVYEFHPWEKKILLAETYVTTDVPILDYLNRLAERGEDPADYDTIWYYY
jgi:lysine 2,3-aminomutase